ncbi:hypothetical protein [Nonomuraea sp. NEAU-A123]|uniref:hypothetical protein n=1 Tax=Nonomuraea sp. NEAU-A123 TaxID=2839649 RepID=UPI001BE46461|nr:hypothetical protein [Nonomuraea sp. NEAU-A123]MBT2234174.1 hypothetical protein [Nonomuraea sp. NEAU-A123]
MAVIEERLGWKPGSFDAILDGGDPEQEPDRSPALGPLVGADSGAQAVWAGLGAIQELTDEERIHLITLLKVLREARGGP